MEEWTVTEPDTGKKYRVTAADEAAALAGYQKMMSEQSSMNWGDVPGAIVEGFDPIKTGGEMHGRMQSDIAAVEQGTGPITESIFGESNRPVLGPAHEMGHLDAQGNPVFGYEDAEGQIQGHVRQDQANQRVDEADLVLDLKDADERDDTRREKEGTHQEAYEQQTTWRPEMDQRIAGQHRAYAGEDHGGEGHDDAILEVLQHAGHLLEHVAVMAEVIPPGKQVPSIGVGNGFDGHQHHPGDGQQHDQTEEDNGGVPQNSAEFRPRPAGVGIRHPFACAGSAGGPGVGKFHNEYS